MWTLVGADALEDDFFDASAPIFARFHPQLLTSDESSEWQKERKEEVSGYKSI